MAGFAAGGLIGAISGGDERYDLTHLTTIEKINIINPASQTCFRFFTFFMINYLFRV